MGGPWRTVQIRISSLNVDERKEKTIDCGKDKRTKKPKNNKIADGNFKPH